MNKELEKVCEELSDEYSKKIVDNWHSLGTYKKADFKAGFKAAIESKKVKDLIEALRFYSKGKHFCSKDLIVETGAKAKEALEAWEGLGD